MDVNFTRFLFSTLSAATLLLVPLAPADAYGTGLFCSASGACTFGYHQPVGSPSAESFRVVWQASACGQEVENYSPILYPSYYTVQPWGYFNINEAHNVPVGDDVRVTIWHDTTYGTHTITDFYDASAGQSATCGSPGSIKNISRPTIAGTDRVGHTLTANVGRWSTVGLTYHYQWYRGTTPIARATYRTYKLPTSARGFRIRVRVTATRSGYTSTSAYSYYTAVVR